jgi:hypothetical protein
VNEKGEWIKTRLGVTLRRWLASQGNRVDRMVYLAGGLAQPGITMRKNCGFDGDAKVQGLG